MAGRRRDGPGAGPQPKGATKKVLFFIKSAGFPHSVVARKGDKPPSREDPLRQRQGARFRGRRLQGRPDVRAGQDRRVGRLRLRDHRRPDHRGGDRKSPPISPEGEKAFYDAIRGGKGFLGMHCAADTFGHFGRRNKGAEDPYIQMIGGEFVSHGAQQESQIEIADPEFPGIDDGFGNAGQSSRSTTNGTP